MLKGFPFISMRTNGPPTAAFPATSCELAAFCCNLLSLNELMPDSSPAPAMRATTRLVIVTGGVLPHPPLLFSVTGTSDERHLMLMLASKDDVMGRCLDIDEGAPCI